MDKYNSKYFFTLASIVILYTAHTAPLYFATFAMPTILRAEGVSLTVIGLLGSLMLPWAFKFLWAPWLDRFYQQQFGKRKTWVIPTQISIIVLLAIMLSINPTQHGIILFGLLFAISFFAATQDIVSAAFVMEQLPIESRALGNYSQVVGTTLGSALGGALILFCYGYMGWTASVLTILILSVTLLLGLYFINESKATMLIKRERPSIWNFWKRKNTRNLLYMCLIYRGCEGLVMGMQQPFLVDSGISVSTIGLVMGIGNMTLGLLVAGIAGYFFKPLGGYKLIILLGIMRSCTYLALFIVASYEINSPTLIFSIVIVNMATRLMEMVTLYTIFMNQCSSNQAATDYAILVCGELIIYMAGISLSGYLAEHLGYNGLFFLGSMLSIPSLIFSANILRKLTYSESTLDKSPKICLSE